MGRCGHQQEVTALAAEGLAELVALGQLDLATEERAAHLVGLVADDQVEVAGGLKPLLQLLVAREHVETGDQQVVLLEEVAGAGRLDAVARQDLELQTELLMELVPLGRLACWLGL